MSLCERHGSVRPAAFFSQSKQQRTQHSSGFSSGLSLTMSHAQLKNLRIRPGCRAAGPDELPSAPSPPAPPELSPGMDCDCHGRQGKRETTSVREMMLHTHA